MSSGTFDDRDSSVQYSGNWEQSGNPGKEYQGTTTYTESAGATARITFTGTGISVFGTIARTDGGATGPASSYSIEGNSSTNKRFQGSAMGEIQYGVNFYEIRNLQYGRHVLIVRWEQSDMQLFLDYFTVVEQSPPPPPPPPTTSQQNQNPPPTPSDSPQPSPSSPDSPTPSSRSEVEPTRSGQPSSGTTSPSNSESASNTSLTNEGSHLPLGPSHSLLLPPGQSALLPNQSSLPPGGLADSSSGGTHASPIKLEAIIGGVVGGFAAMCIVVLLFVLCMRRRRRRQEQRYGGISSPNPEMQDVSQQPRSSPAYHDGNSLATGDLSTSVMMRDPTPSYSGHSYPSTTSEGLAQQLTPQPGPLPTKSRVASMGPPPQYQPTA